MNRWTGQPHGAAAGTPWAVRLRDVTKRYGQGPRSVLALDRVSTDIPQGTFTALMGPSGSGKSTFLHMAAGLGRPTSGSVWLGDTELSRLKETPLTRLRRGRTGFVSRTSDLVPALTVLQNITLPLRLQGRRPDGEWLFEVVARAGLTGHLKRVPSELSAGRRQRVAIARALMTRPDVVFADEPTGALDPGTARDILGLLREAVTDLHRTVVMATHDPVAAAHADSAVLLAHGRVVSAPASPAAGGATAPTAATAATAATDGLRRTA
ncbi:ABC transporter ATP-binding protein [Streptomyces sp. NPDC004065]|uniref:ABC transporter ATP-binding protein n=1 Tax=Streptomyces sp. NPDC004065 TaxID=3364689 RepID=UPI00384A8427